MACNLLIFYWNTGILEYWNTGILEYWNTGILETMAVTMFFQSSGIACQRLYRVNRKFLTKTLPSFWRI
jgi:hypothetical protein